MPKFTYEIKKSGFNQTITVFDNGKSIYSNNSPTSTEADLVRIAKVALRDNYGSGVDQMVKVSSPTLSTPAASSLPTTPAASSISENQQNIKQSEEKVNQISQQQQDKFNNLSNSLQDQADMAKSMAKTAVVGIITSLITKFINNDIIINATISNLIKKTKRKLKNKGRVEVKNKVAIVFYPKFSGDYSPYKQEFERKKANLLKVVKIMKTIIVSLIVVLKLVKTALTIIQLKLKTRKKKLLATAIASGPDLASPSPSKPIAAQYPANKEIDDQVTKDLEDKINNYILLITFVQTILRTLQQVLIRAKFKVERLSFNTNIDIALNGGPRAVIPEQDNADSTIYNNGIRNYTIEVITTPAGDLQAVAYDAFSKMKITQTAPSKTRKANELIEELKLILG